MEMPNRILVVNVSRIGDTLAATPVLHQLHRLWPHAEITVLGGARRVEVIEHLPGVQRVAILTKRSAWLQGWLCRKSYDLALVYNYDEPLVRYALRAAKRVVAFRQRSENVNRQLYRCVDPNAYPTEHITEHFHRLLTALDLPIGDGRIRYSCLPSEADAAKLRLHERGLGGARPLVGLQVASFQTKSYRDWPIASFLALSRRILNRWPRAAFILFGGRDERSRTLTLASELGDHACHLAGELTLRETAATMSLIDVYIGVDTGPTHLMSSYDIPIVGLYHSRHPAAQLGPKDHPLNFSLDHPYNDDLDGEPRSMADISVDQVYGQVEKGLASRGFV
jgi:heptosyltransferase-3